MAYSQHNSATANRLPAKLLQIFDVGEAVTKVCQQATEFFGVRFIERLARQKLTGVLPLHQNFLTGTTRGGLGKACADKSHACAPPEHTAQKHKHSSRNSRHDHRKLNDSIMDWAAGHCPIFERHLVQVSVRAVRMPEAQHERHRNEGHGRNRDLSCKSSIESLRHAAHATTGRQNRQSVNRPARPAALEPLESRRLLSMVPVTFEYTVDDGHGGQDTATVTINVCPPGDATLDGNVNVFDLLLVGQNYLKPDFDPLADVTGDGAVNLFDLLTVRSNYLTQWPETEVQHLAEPNIAAATEPPVPTAAELPASLECVL